jgi:hypothetical protein
VQRMLEAYVVVGIGDPGNAQTCSRLPLGRVC